ncbi:restriction endonuclease subunit S [Alistipes communis]|uniref:restriction endonuclease subunit S n=2 Tax=Alistipes communis TaxID=2585118 RepID=UPI003CED3B58
MLDFYSTNSLSWEQLEYDTNTVMNLHYGLIHVGLPTMVDLAKDKLPNIKKENMPKNFELCKEGDVAFADASEDTNEVAKTIEFYNLARENIVCGLHTIHGRDNKNKTVVGFKGYAFSSAAFHNQIRRIAQGTKIYSISTKNFSECYIGLPSKPEQTKIATLLRLIDERISTQNKIIDKLQSLIKGLRNEIFWKLRKNVGFNAMIGDVLDYEQPQSYIVEDTEYIDKGTPVLTANKAFILGYTSETEGIYDKGDCIIFDDFTLDSKYVDFPFKVKSSAIKILSAENKELLRYTFEFLKYLDLSTSEHKRHYIAETQNQEFILPTTQIVRTIAHTFSILSLRMETAIKQRLLFEKQKQYLLRQMFI